MGECFDYPNVRKNPVELEYIDNHVSTTAKTFDDVAEEVPKLGTFSNWKLWNGIWKQTDNLIGTKTGQIKTYIQMPVLAIEVRWQPVKIWTATFTV